MPFAQIVSPQVVALATDLDSVSVNLSDGFQLAMKIVIAGFLFGIALDTRWTDFADVVRRPGVIATGLVAQYLVAPALTLLITLALDVRGSIAIGMLLIACCPAGNLSNLLTHRARGDVALSISMTGVSNVLALVVTPVAVAFWCGLNPAAAELLRGISLDPWEVVTEVALLIALPFAAGLLVAWRRPALASRASRIVEPGSLVLLLLIVVGGLAGNLPIIRDHLALVVIPVVLQNAMALLLGYGTARACRLPEAGTRAMTFELGVRNTGLGVALALSFFGELGGAVIVAALWGLWDATTGLALASWWRRRTPSDQRTPRAAGADTTRA